MTESTSQFLSGLSAAGLCWGAGIGAGIPGPPGWRDWMRGPPSLSKSMAAGRGGVGASGEPDCLPDVEIGEVSILSPARAVCWKQSIPAIITMAATGACLRVRMV